MELNLKLAIILSDDFNIEIPNQENHLIIRTPDLLKASIIIDKHIYKQRNKIDYVLFLQTPDHKINNFIPQMAEDWDTVYLSTEKSHFNFYCIPETFAMIASVNKLKLNDIPQWRNNLVSEDELDLKILYSITKLALRTSIIS